MRCALLVTTMVVSLLLQATAFAQSASPTVEDAEKFIKEAEVALSAESVRVNRIQWVNSTYLTEDTDALAAEAGARQTELRFASLSRRRNSTRCRAFPTRSNASSIF